MKSREPLEELTGIIADEAVGVFSVGLNEELDDGRNRQLSGYSHRQSCRRGMVGRFGSHMGGSRGHHRCVVSWSCSSSGRWACWDRVLGRCGPVGDSVPSPAGMDRRMGSYRTGQMEVSTHSVRPPGELTLAGSFISIQDPSMSTPFSGL